MSFKVGDLPFFDEYQFTDTNEVAKHFGLVLLPEEATQYQESVLCCVVTSREPKQAKWGLPLACESYSCFTKPSFACFNRKDLVSKRGLGAEPQPKGALTESDFLKAFKILKKSLFAIQDIASDPFLRGTIIRAWKKKLAGMNI
jgi:hypothetical protein